MKSINKLVSIFTKNIAVIYIHFASDVDQSSENNSCHNLLEIGRSSFRPKGQSSELLNATKQDERGISPGTQCKRSLMVSLSKVHGARNLRFLITNTAEHLGYDRNRP